MNKRTGIKRQERCMRRLPMNSISQSLIFIAQDARPNSLQARPSLGRATLYTAGMPETAIFERTAVVRHGRKLEYFTIAWNAIEGLVAVVAGTIAGSISLVGFGIDSFIEVTSGSVLQLWRMSVDAEVQRRELNEAGP